MDYTVHFEFAGHDIRAAISELPQTVELDLENVIGAGGMPGSRGPVGTAKLVVIRQGVKSLVVDGKNRPLVHHNKDGEEEVVIPNLRERNPHRSLLDKLVEEVVKKNDWLCFTEPFDQIFGRYAPEETEELPEERRNPTSSPGSGGIEGSVSSTDTSTSAISTPAR
ncbi:hypothetical protein [Rubrobacter calidifluminis]|uniref:hypothetical protein n=1 Tax=Rubrobacter calidifluminis TaxID=1392640 RepID=UPI0023629F6B|nr:hypothetical protein [Rubrobacter calidifluminis]